MRSDRAEHVALVAEVEADDLERNLRLIGVGENLKRWSKAGVGDHVRSQFPGAFMCLRPAMLRLAIHRQHQHGMVCRKIRGRVVAAVSIRANSHHHIRIRTQHPFQFLEKNATHVRGSSKIRIIRSGEDYLGQPEQILVRDKLGLADLKISRSLPCRVQEWTTRLRSKQQRARSNKSGNHSCHWLILTQR